MKEIVPRSQINASVKLPGSKSLSHRALIAASLANGKSLLKGVLDSEDTNYTRSTLENLGIGISDEGEALAVRGNGGNFVPVTERRELFVGNSGTSMRLLLATAALGQGEHVLDGTARMKQRPVGELVQALNVLGSEVSYLEKSGFPPVLVSAKGLEGGKVTISGAESSQYISSLLLAGPYAKKGIEIEATGSIVSGPYIDMTLDVMRDFGVDAYREGYRFFGVKGGQRFQARQYSVEADVSNASYFWAAAAVTGGTVITENINAASTHQGDIGFLELLEEMGCVVGKEADRVTIQGRALSAVEVDMSGMPDLVPTLAAVSLFAEGKTTIRNVAHLRLKESDRLGAVRSEWKKLGARVEELADGLVVHGGKSFTGTVVDPHDDHRLAMSLAVIGLKVPGLRIENEMCVNKSFPEFWKLWEAL